MTDIQKLSTEQKLAEVVVLQREALAVFKDNSISLKDAFNTATGERLNDYLRDLVKSLAKDLGVTDKTKTLRDRYLDVTLTKIADKAEKKGIDVSALRAVLTEATPLIDIAYKEVKANRFNIADPGVENMLRIMEMQRKYLNSKSKGGPKQ